MNYIKKHTELTLSIILLILCVLLYFINISSYPFIDTDETKFVSIAKEMLNNNNWLNITLSGENLYTESPLFYWITNISCLIFGKISTLAVRFPISVIAALGILALFFSIRSILTNTYAFIISLMFSTCLGTLIFSRLATNNLLFSYSVMAAVLLAYLSILSRKEKNTVILWIGIYTFSALATLCSGLFGIFIPLLSIVAMHIFSGDLKEIIKPKHLFPGLSIFLLIVLPWHMLMIQQHSIAFLKEYLSSYNILLYTSPKQILSVIGLFILGFSPWSFSFLWILGRKSKDILNSVLSYFKENSQDKLKEKWKKLNKIDKFLSLNTIVFFTAFFFAILYGAKYTFLILFLMFPAACISGHYWYEYIIKKQHDKSIFFATIIPNLILIICSLIILFGHNFLNTMIFQGLNHLIIPFIIIFFIIPTIAIFAVILKGQITSFTSNLILMLSLSFILTPSIFNFIAYKGGEYDLINFTKLATENKAILTSFIHSKKYSILYYYDKKVNFYSLKDINFLKKYLKEHPNEYIIVEIKDLWTIEDNKIKYMLLDAGTRYCLIQHMPYEQIKENSEEAEVIIY